MKVVLRTDVSMRIQSNFKDYYDKIQAYTYGESTVYTRAWVMSNLKDTPLHLLQSSIGGTEKSSLFCVGFCGKLYYGRRISWYETVDRVSKRFDRYFFDAESLKTFQKSRHPHTFWNKEDERKLAPSFQVIKDNSFFIKDNAPISFWDYDSEICCPLELKGRTYHRNIFDYGVGPNFSLQSIGFESILSAESAYTELCGYIGGTLSREYKEIPEMTDLVKIESHGFDKKSFRRRLHHQ